MMKTVVFILLLSLGSLHLPAETIEYKAIPYLVYEVDLSKGNLELFWKDSSGMRLGSFRRVKEEVEKKGLTLSFAMNAGIFDPGFSPLGLHIASGKVLRPLNMENGDGNFYMKPNGVFILEKGTARIEDAARLSSGKTLPELAVQSGPLLVLNGVGVNGKGKIVLVLSRRPVTFYEFASFFRERLHCENALYLDGAISRAYSPQDDEYFLEGDYAGILAVTAKKL